MTLVAFELTRWSVLKECQPDFEATITNAVWSSKSIIVAAALFKAGYTPREIIEYHILDNMADSNHLFVPENFELFINTCFSCGPKLDALSCQSDQVTAVINKAPARVPAGSKMFKLAIAGLVAARENDWIVETNTAPRVSPETKSTTPRVLTPKIESAVELEVVTQGDLLPPE